MVYEKIAGNIKILFSNNLLFIFYGTTLLSPPGDCQVAPNKYRCQKKVAAASFAWFCQCYGRAMKKIFESKQNCFLKICHSFFMTKPFKVHLVAATGRQSGAAAKKFLKSHSEAKSVEAICLGTLGNDSLHIPDCVERQHIGPGSLSIPHRGRRFPSKGQKPSRVGHRGSVWSCPRPYAAASCVFLA